MAILFSVAFCGYCHRASVPVKQVSRPHFITVSPKGEEHIAYILNEDKILIGRMLNNAFVIEHPPVSKRHARVVIEAD